MIQSYSKVLAINQPSLYISDTLSGSEFMAGIYMKSDTLSIGEVIDYSQDFKP